MPISAMLTRLLPCVFLTGVIACGDRPPTLDCDTLGLGVSQGIPGSAIPLLGTTPSVLEGVEIAISNGTTAVPGLFGVDAAGGVTLAAPAHPTGTIEGGGVTIAIGACDPLPFTIAPLRPAPGEVGRLLGVLQSQMAARFTALGTSRAAIRSAAPGTLHPLSALMESMAHTLDSVAAEWPTEGADDPGTVLLEAMVAAHELVDRLASQDQVATAATRVPPPSLYRHAAFAAQLPAGTGECGLFGFEITMAEHLACLMGAAQYHEMATTGEPRQILDLLGVTLAVGSAIPLPGVSQAYAGAGVALTVTIAVQEAMAMLLPRRFTDLELTLSNSALDEDDPSPLRWTDARATSMSDTWDPNLAVANIAIARLTFKTEVPLMKELNNSLAGTITGAREMLEKNLATNLGGIGIGTALPSVPDSPVRLPVIGPMTYTGTDVTAPAWTEARLIGDAFTFGPRGVLVPSRAGSSTLRLTIRPEQFYGRSYSTDQEITIRTITVTVTPPMATLRAGESEDFAVDVLNAKDPRVKWELVPAGGYTLSVASGGTRARVTAPRDGARKPAELRVTSLAKRDHLMVRPDRVGRANVRGEAVVIDPEEGCVPSGQTLAFTIEGPTNVPGYDWRASAGSITEDGVFTAPPSGDGTATITAEVKSDEGIRGERLVAYGPQCNCRGTLTLGPPISKTWQGLASWSQGPNSFGIQLMPAVPLQDLLANRSRNISLMATMAGEPIEGTQPVRTAILMGNLNEINQVAGAIDPESRDPATAIVSLTMRRNGTELVGTLLGTIEASTAEGSGKVPIRYDFRALLGSAMDNQSPFFTCYIALQRDD